VFCPAPGRCLCIGVGEGFTIYALQNIDTTQRLRSNTVEFQLCCCLLRLRQEGHTWQPSRSKTAGGAAHHQQAHHEQLPGVVTSKTSVQVCFLDSGSKTWTAGHNQYPCRATELATVATCCTSAASTISFSAGSVGWLRTVRARAWYQLHCPVAYWEGVDGRCDMSQACLGEAGSNGQQHTTAGTCNTSVYKRTARRHVATRRQGCSCSTYNTTVHKPLHLLDAHACHG